MRKTVDQPLWYRGEFNSESLCRIRVYKEEGKAAVVLLSEVPDNPGTPLLLASDSLIPRLWKKLKQPEEFNLLVEHSDGDVSEVLMQVGPISSPYIRPGRELCETDPRLWTWAWDSLSREEAEERIGQPLTTG